MEYELIKKNPTDYAKPPRKIQTVEEIENKKQEIKFLEKEELVHFLITAKKKGLSQDGIVFSILAYSGMRIGELLALKWKDIDFEESTINITKTLYNPKNRTKEYQLLSPKTKGSIRKIKMDANVMNDLKQHKKEQNKLKMMIRDEYVDQDFVIAKSSGYPENVKVIENRMKRILKLAEIDRHLTPHSLRHTHTSLLIEAGVGIKEIQQRLGHTDIETTMNIYAHMTADMEEKASHKFSELMRSLF
ncbi:site-specific integrase [Alkalihalobacillus alcalophilus]|nr:site-specific integrase [Alkalihalobacillus alcalophilus]